MHDDDILLLREDPGNLNRSLDGLGSGVPEEERVERFVRHEGKELLDKPQIRAMIRDATLEAERPLDQEHEKQDVDSALTCACTMFRHCSAAA